MPVTFGQASSQNARWERGRLQLVPSLPLLLARGLARRDPQLLDAVAEQLIPPLSVPFALGLLWLVAGVLARSARLVGLAGACLAAQVAYMLTALALVRAPRRVGQWCPRAPA